MATSSLPRAASRGGSFLVESCTPEDVFSPAELTDDQKLIGQTAEEFVRNEVVPQIPDLEQHKPGLLPGLLKKAGEIGLLGGGVPDEYGGAGLDKVSTVQLAEKLSAYASSFSSAPTSRRKSICPCSPRAKSFRLTVCLSRKPDRTRKIPARAPCSLPMAARGF
jgi:hypothetical protein